MQQYMVDENKQTYLRLKKEQGNQSDLVSELEHELESAKKDLDRTTRLLKPFKEEYEREEPQ